MNHWSSVNPSVVVELNAMRGWLVKRKSVQINPSASLIRFVFVYMRGFIYIYILLTFARAKTRDALRDSVRI